MNRKNNACRVMISNIPDYMEPEDLRPIFEEVGPVKSLEFVYHANTGAGKKHKHKGYGFCEYFDVAGKDAAVANLSQRSINGVVLRVKPADGGKETAVKEHEAQQKIIPRLELDATTPIAQRLKELSLTEIYEAVEQMKQLVADDEEKSKEILKQNPQLCMAMLHIFYYMGIIRRDPEAEQTQRMRGA
eukprot:TRINITY_DN8965_c1_g3_i1.p1 TRINITY_DN8965_c1_g3~~TRINITY_DN8965_c1_g3_i1.p1  ORF type:complete len:188 (+),score=42.28 TRINITY_DN8965_c1_g3_i1:61-624(+)